MADLRDHCVTLATCSSFSSWLVFIREAVVFIRKAFLALVPISDEVEKVPTTDVWTFSQKGAYVAKETHRSESLWSSDYLLLEDLGPFSISVLERA